MDVCTRNWTPLRYGLIWVCFSPDFAGRYSLRQPPGAKKDSRTPQQFREMNTLVPDIKVGFGVASDPPIHAFKPVSKARFMSGTPVILSSIHGHLYQAVQSLNLTRSEYRTKRALAGVSLYGGAGELLRFGIEARSRSR